MKIITNNIFKIAAVVAIFLFSSCDEEPYGYGYGCSEETDLSGVDEDQLAKDIEAIDQYLEENNIEAEEHPSGLRYRVVEEGDGRSPTRCQRVIITYLGKRMSDGQVFDKTPVGEVSVFTLSQLILGWQVGIPLVEEGAKVILYIPSQLGYGKYGSSGTIPANENLIFTIELKSVG